MEVLLHFDQQTMLVLGAQEDDRTQVLGEMVRAVLRENPETSCRNRIFKCEQASANDDGYYDLRLIFDSVGASPPSAEILNAIPGAIRSRVAVDECAPASNL